MNNLNGWGPISQVITKFEKLLEKYLPVKVWISSKELKILAEEDHEVLY